MASDGLGLLCVHAHPDDEATSTGATLLRYAREGVRTAVVTCTGGERGEIHNMDVEATRPRLREVRLEELRTALKMLGAGEPRMLGYVDSGMMGTEGNDDPASFWRADMDEAVGRLVAHIRELQPEVVITYDAFGGYGHPDHIQAHRVAVLASEASGMASMYPDAGPPWRVRKVYLATFPRSAIFRFAVTMTEMGMESPFGVFERVEDVPMGVDDDLIGAIVDNREQVGEKMEALRAHTSQIEPGSFFFSISPEYQAEAFGREYFIRLRSDVPVTGVEDDLFAGLRT